MANPQLKDGKTEFANELADALCKINLSAYEWRIFWFIARKTYGWHKKTDRISYSQFETGTGIDHRHIGRSIASLKMKNIISVSGTGYMLEYGIQKDYDQWKFNTKQGTELTPNGALKSDDNLTPIQGELTPIQGELTPNGALKSVPIEAHTKAIKHITKASTKDISKKETFEEYLQKKVMDFPTLDVLQEWKDCQDWYAEKGKTITIPKSALNNWLKIALMKQTKIGGQNYGTNQKSSSRPPRQLPSTYTDPDEYRREQQAKADGLSSAGN